MRTCAALLVLMAGLTLSPPPSGQIAPYLRAVPGLTAGHTLRKIFAGREPLLPGITNYTLEESVFTVPPLEMGGRCSIRRFSKRSQP